MGIRWWLDALNTAWDRVWCAGGCGRTDIHTAPNWLRRDLGLMEDDVKSLSERIDEIRGKQGWWL